MSWTPVLCLYPWYCVLDPNTVSWTFEIGVFNLGTGCLGPWYWVLGPWYCVLTPVIVSWPLLLGVLAPDILLGSKYWCICVCVFICVRAGGRAGRRAGVRVICAMYMCARACPYVCVCMLRVCLCVCACAFVRVCISLVDGTVCDTPSCAVLILMCYWI